MALAMAMFSSCLMALCPAAALPFATEMPGPAGQPDGRPRITSETRGSQPVASMPALPEAGPMPDAAQTPEIVDVRDEGHLRIGKVDVFDGGKLLLTNGVTTVEGSSGGGLARWATIGGRQMPGGIGATGHFTAIELPDYGWRSYGIGVGLGDRLEVSLARADFDTRDVGAALGIGKGYTFNLDTFGAKLRIVGDLLYGKAWLPQIAIGVEHKRSRDGDLVRALGASDDKGTDYTLSATKLLLSRSLLINATLRYTKANELGLLGFGSGRAGHQLQVEGSLAYQLSRRAVIGAEYRSKPDNLGLGEDDWMDLFAAYALTDHLTLTVAYVDLGSIATIPDQRGGFVSAQVAF
jgi:hypothetical protein